MCKMALQEEKEYLLLIVEKDRKALLDQRRGLTGVLEELEENINKRYKVYSRNSWKNI